MMHHCRHGARGPRTIHSTARLTLVAALCALVLPTSAGWVQYSHLIADDAAVDNGFGWSVAIDGDTIVVGAPQDYTGSVYVFTRDGGGWSQRDHLFADDAWADDAFGASVAIDGDTIVVGAPLDNTAAAGPDAGSAYVFKRTGGIWSQQDHLFADDAESDDELGQSVAISWRTIVVGGPTSGISSGSAYVFVRHDPAGVWYQVAHLYADDAADGDGFGRSVSISSGTIVVGAPWGQSTNTGSAYVFTRAGSVWPQVAHLLADDAAAWDYFGQSVAISGDTIVVGAHNDDTAAGSMAGSAYVFRRTGGTWSQQGHLYADDAAANDWFGGSVASSRGNIVVGAPEDDTAAGSYTGSAYVFGPSFRIFVAEPELPIGH